MKKSTLALQPSKKVPTKPGSARKNKGGVPGKRTSKSNFWKEVLGFGWLKKAMVGKTREESLDLLDQWILKKRALTLFF